MTPIPPVSSTAPTARRRVAGLALAAAVAAAGGLLLPAPAAAEPVTGGTLDWGIRASFRTYIVGPVARGTITTDAPASAGADGTFRFPTAGGDATAGGALDLAFSGAVHFRGHGYHDPAAGDLLQVSVADIRIQGSGTASLVADVTSLPLPDDLTDPGPAGSVRTYDDVELATIALDAVTPEPTASGFVLRDVPVRVTAAGAEAFAGFYTAGEALDPLTITVTTAGAGPAAPARSGGSSPGASVGVTVAAAGTGGGTAGTGTLAHTGWSGGAAVAGLALVAAGIAVLATAGAATRLAPARVRVSGGGGGGDGRRR